MAFVGDSLNDNLYEGIVCLLQATTRVVFKKVTVGNRKLGSYFVPNYNLTTLTINSGYLVQSPRYTTNHKTAVYTMNPKWATLLPYTDAIVFNAGHWFFHPVSVRPCASDSISSPAFPLVAPQVTVMKRSTMKVAEITYMSAMRPDAHLYLNGRDCSHWCLPGVPDAWSDVLYNILMGVRRNFT
ncbi:unnamed protein product [Closterium sp. NIES-53]